MIQLATGTQYNSDVTLALRSNPHLAADCSPEGAPGTGTNGPEDWRCSGETER